MKTSKKPIAAVAEIADRTAYIALINDHLNNNRPRAYCPMFLATYKKGLLTPGSARDSSAAW